MHWNVNLPKAFCYGWTKLLAHNVLTVEWINDENSRNKGFSCFCDSIKNCKIFKHENMKNVSRLLWWDLWRVFWLIKCLFYKISKVKLNFYHVLSKFLLNVCVGCTNNNICGMFFRCIKIFFKQVLKISNITFTGD